MSSSPLVLSTVGSKSELRKMYDKVMGSTGLAKHHVAESAKSLRAGGESAVVGAALGAAHAMLPTGLDMTYHTGTHSITIPVDAGVAVAGLIGAAILGEDDDFADDVRNAGAAAAAIYAFRQTAQFVATKRAQKGLSTGGVPASQIAGDPTNGDRIVNAARRIAVQGR